MSDRTVHPITVRLDPADLELARRLANREGTSHKAFLKQLIHDALQREVSLDGR